MSDVRHSEEGGVLTFTITRDEKLNAFTDDMVDELRDAVARLGDREDVRVLVIAAEGRYFTSGMDIARFSRPQSRSGVALRRFYRRIHLLLDELEAIEKPIVVAMQGPCLGLGVELAVSCDFRFASDRTTFQLPEIANLAMIPGSGGISRLTRLVGPHWARWIAMAGEPLDANQAVAIGLVHDVVAEDALAERVTTFAARLASRSVEALGLAKIGIDSAADADRVTARNIDRIANTMLRQSDEFREAAAALAARPRKGS